MKLGTFMRKERERLEMIQGEIAKACQVSTTTVFKWESGSKYPDVHDFAQWCYKLGFVPGDIINQFFPAPKPRNPNLPDYLYFFIYGNGGGQIVYQVDLHLRTCEIYDPPTGVWRDAAKDFSLILQKGNRITNRELKSIIASLE